MEYETDYMQRFAKIDVEVKKSPQKALNCVKKLYIELFNDAKLDYKKLTELVHILGARSNKYKGSSIRFQKLYKSLWERANDYAVSHLKYGELDYYFDHIE